MKKTLFSLLLLAALPAFAYRNIDDPDPMPRETFEAAQRPCAVVFPELAAAGLVKSCSIDIRHFGSEKTLAGKHGSIVGVGDFSMSFNARGAVSKFMYSASTSGDAAPAIDDKFAAMLSTDIFAAISFEDLLGN
jgi:hypothetical protein